MVKQGNWAVSLDAGDGDDHTIEIGGAAQLQVGEVLPGTQYGRKWRIDHVSPGRLFARAVPVDDDD